MQKMEYHSALKRKKLNEMKRYGDNTSERF